MIQYHQLYFNVYCLLFRKVLQHLISLENNERDVFYDQEIFAFLINHNNCRYNDALRLFLRRKAFG